MRTSPAVDVHSQGKQAEKHRKLNRNK